MPCKLCKNAKAHLNAQTNIFDCTDSHCKVKKLNKAYQTAISVQTAVMPRLNVPTFISTAEPKYLYGVWEATLLFTISFFFFFGHLLNGDQLAKDRIRSPR